MGVCRAEVEKGCRVLGFVYRVCSRFVLFRLCSNPGLRVVVVVRLQVTVAGMGLSSRSRSESRKRGVG